MSVWPWLLAADLEGQRWAQTTIALLIQYRISHLLNVILGFNLPGNDLECKLAPKFDHYYPIAFFAKASPQNYILYQSLALKTG